VNNLNTHPPVPVSSNLLNFDVIVEQPSSTSPPSAVAAKKTKNINKNKIKPKVVDEEYRCSSDDEDYV